MSLCSHKNFFIQHFASGAPSARGLIGSSCTPSAPYSWIDRGWFGISMNPVTGRTLGMGELHDRVERHHCDPSLAVTNTKRDSYLGWFGEIVVVERNSGSELDLLVLEDKGPADLLNVELLVEHNEPMIVVPLPVPMRVWTRLVDDRD